MAISDEEILIKYHHRLIQKRIASKKYYYKHKPKSMRERIKELEEEIRKLKENDENSSRK
jgi:hypothetical protein